MIRLALFFVIALSLLPNEVLAKPEPQSVFFSEGLIERLLVLEQDLSQGASEREDTEALEALLRKDRYVIRDLKLGGILFKSRKDWTIWLNGEKITRDNLPDEIRKINVAKDYAEIIWFDAILKEEVPVRIRPHQTFNLDAKMFLPG